MNSDSVKYAAWCYGLRFAPAIVILVFSHLLNVLDLVACASAEVALDGDDTSPAANETESRCPENVESNSSAGFQLCNLVFAFVYLSAISLSFVSRNHQIWQFLPTRAWDETNVAGCVIFACFQNNKIQWGASYANFKLVSQKVKRQTVQGADSQGILTVFS